MIKNICKNKDCRGWDSDFPNNCRIVKEIKSCRILESQRAVKIKNIETGTWRLS